MKQVTYFCNNCHIPYAYEESEAPIGKEMFCPKCSNQLNYWITEEINPDTEKVINKYKESARETPHLNVSNPINNINSASSVKCHYCGSTNTKKIGVISRSVSVGLFGIGSKKINRQWHCNNCGSDF